MTDVELKNGFITHHFNPSPSELVRLDTETRRFRRYRINSMMIKWEPLCSTTTDGSVRFGISVGSVQDAINASNITTLTPSASTPVWKAASIKVGTSVMMQPHLFCGGTDLDSVAFTLYIGYPKLPTGTLSKYGQFKVTYDVTLTYPTVKPA